jgi:hypothetical protein
VETGRPISEFSDDELRAYACSHVLYEIRHFVRAAQAADAAWCGLFPENFAVEVFALHVRTLLDFFGPRKPRPTDACAHHFFKGWQPLDVEGNLYLREARRMADKHVAHLTTDRTDDPDLKTWPVEAIVWTLKPTIEQFADGAELICNTFRERVHSVLAELHPRRDHSNLRQGSGVATQTPGR